MRISDWSSDVCSSDLKSGDSAPRRCTVSRKRSSAAGVPGGKYSKEKRGKPAAGWAAAWAAGRRSTAARRDRKSVGEGKSVAVRVDLGSRRIIKNTRHYKLC